MTATVCATMAALLLATVARGATVTTDQGDYPPGATALISGSGWAPGETVRLQVLHADGTPSTGADHDPWTVVANASGNISSNWHVCEDDCVYSILELTAIGQTSGAVAKARFTDGSTGLLRLTSVTAVGSACVFGPSGPGTQHWDVQAGQTYTLVFTFPSRTSFDACLGGSLPNTISLTLQGYGVPFTATRNGNSANYTATVTIPGEACRTTPIRYCGGFVRRADGNFHQAHLRTAIFQAGCTNPTERQCCVAAPNVTCPANITTNTAPARCDATVTFTASATPGCPDVPVTVVCVPPSGSTFGPGTTTVTCTATDAAGQTDSCTFTVTVRDQEPPGISCAADRIIECPTPPSFDMPTATDNCTNVTVRIVSTTTNTVGCSYSVTRVWEAMDTAGNTARCSQTITVIDTTPPVLSGVPANRTFQCPADVPPLPPVTATDLCDGNVPVTVSCTTNGSCPTVITCTWTAVDRCTNSASATRTITVNDTIPPILHGVPASQTVQCIGDVTPANVTATDNCDGNVPVIAAYTTNGSCPTIIICTWTARDRCTNSASATRTITVNDTIPPVLHGVPGNQSFQCISDVPPLANVTATDNCDGAVPVTVSCSTNGSCPTIITCTWTARDRCTNSASATRTITVHDTVPPVITCAPDVTAECGTPVAFTRPTALDACDGTNVVIRILGTQTNRPCGNTFTATRTWEAEDRCGNRSTCSQTIRVGDTTPPTIVCAGPQTIECPAMPNFPPPTVSDVCDPAPELTFADARTPGACPQAYSVTRTWTARDACGNAASCSQTITVVDTTPPTLVGVPPDAVYQCIGDVPNVTVTATDLCDPDVPVFPASSAVGPCPTVIFNTWTATDDCGNSITATQRVLIQEEALVITQSPANVLACLGSDATFCVSVQSACPVTYQWSKDGAVIPGATESCYTRRTVGAADAGMYCVVVRSPCQTATNCFRLAVGATIGDFVWEDVNGNGCQDGTEPGLPDVIVLLLDCTGNLLSVTNTDSSGLYRFNCVPPGQYVVQFLPLPGYHFAPANACDDATDSDANTATGQTACFTVGSGEINLTIDGGMIRPGALGDFVWNDLNMDGRQDSGEPGVSNVTVRLQDCAGNVLATTTTDVNGLYLFTGLEPGSYKVTFVSPPNMVFTVPNATSDEADSDADPLTGMTGCYTIVSGQTNLTVDAGLFVPTPCIVAVKEIACLLPGDQCGAFGESATGVKSGAQNPAFCYRITVRNCGVVALRDVTVIDNRLGNLTSQFFDGVPATLASGASITRHFKMAWGSDTVNTVTAAGVSTFNGQTVQAEDSATAHVITAGIACQELVISPADLDGNPFDNHVQLPKNGQSHAVTFIAIVSNTGQAPLANVTVTSSLPGCGPLAPFNLPVGATVTSVVCTITASCDQAPLADTLSVGAAIDTREGACAFDLTGVPVTVGSQCSAIVDCRVGACRVTGGGRQERQLTFPSVRYVTHGGQVGAPVGNETEFDPDSECIRGNWEHVRHVRGGTRGNFHAKSFDSLMCACLACPESAGSGVVVGDLCNPDDRICGSEPRRAPANKICFSGVGDYTMTSGNRQARSVLFRVDLEDHSEPGNSHAGGSQEPHDRYRIRIWILNAAELAALNNANDRLLDFRRSIACSPGSTATTDGAPGSRGSAVFGVRAPDIDDGGELNHGNHQIHPMIKDCP